MVGADPPPVRYQPVTLDLFADSDLRFQAWIDADLGVNVIENADHVDGATDRRFVGLVRVFGQITF